MASAIAKDLRSKNDAAWAELTRQLQGMGPFLKLFATPSLPVIDLEPGVTI